MKTFRDTIRLVLSSGFVLLCVVAVLSMVACPSGGRSSDLIVGKITTLKDQEIRPVAQAQIVIRPLTPDPETKGSDEQPEDPSNLRGVSITNDTGHFEISSFSSSSTFSEYGLLRNWRCEIIITVPGYYIYKGPFSYSKGGQKLTIELEEKNADVTDVTGVIEIDEKAIQTGSIRRGN